MSNAKGDHILSNISIMVCLERNIQEMVELQEDFADYIIKCFGNPKIKVEHIRSLAEDLINVFNEGGSEADKVFFYFCNVINAYLCPEQGARFQKLIREYDSELLQILRVYGLKKFRISKKKQ